MKSKKLYSEPRMNVLELATHLRREHIFINNERQQMIALNEKVLSTSSRLFYTAWISREQRFNLDKFVSHGNSDLLNCCTTCNALENTQFIDSYKKLGNCEASVAQLFSSLRKNPQLLAHCLMTEERHNSELIQLISQVIMSSIYSHCILNEDKVLALQMMKEIVCQQLSHTDNPRRLLRHSSCAFSHMYRIFSEEILDAKPFLTASLHDPIMQLLAEDDLFLDIDPNRAVMRFAPNERLRHFGKEGTAIYSDNLQKYRVWTINKLVSFVNKFIEGIQNNIFCFPQSLSWIVKELYNTLIKNKRIEVREIGAMCADLIFGFFICPAIHNPDLMGITDAYVSHIARFNLMQVAQIIQVLALSKWEQIDPKLDDLYSKFQKDSISSIFDFILEKCDEDLNVENQITDITRFCVLIPEFDLKNLLNFLNGVKNDIMDESMQKTLCNLLDQIPEKLLSDLSSKFKTNIDVNKTMINNSPRVRKSILNRVTRKNRLNDTHDSHQTNNNSNVENQSQAAANSANFQSFDVLIIPIGSIRECPGMLSEDKVLRLEQQKRHTKVRLNLDMLLPNNNSEETESVASAVSGSETPIEKRTRFSLSQDQESIGTSDNLEAISEAASNHSVESSIDLENENDNMSDMVSANVSSGRGTPNVSGRDTPSSHSPNQSGASSDDDVEPEPLANRTQASNISTPNTRTLNTIPITQPNRPNNRDDIEDKFGKFDIKPVVAVDETKSMLSDTWSTDVLASDSEAFEQSENLAAAASLSQTGAINMLGFPGHQLHALQSVLDSETASQSDAWSTDVLTSDTERLQEFDPDDSASVTRSEPDDESFNNIYIDSIHNESDNTNNATIKPRNIKINVNSMLNSNFAQDMSDGSANSLVMHSKNSLSNSSSNNMKITEGNDCERISFNELTLTENDNSEIFASVSPTLLTYNMQSLGRLSFDIKKFDEDISLQSLLQENLYANFRANGLSNTGVAELLSIDMPHTKNSSLETSNSLIDFEKEISIDDKPSNHTVINDSSINIEISNESIHFSNDSVKDDICTTVTNAESRINNSNTTEQTNYMQNEGNKVMAVNGLPKSLNKIASTGAIPKVPKPILTVNNRSSRQFISDEDINRQSVNRKGFFKLPNFKSTFREKMRSFKDNKRSSVDDNTCDSKGDATKGIKVTYDQHYSTESSDEILAKYRAKNTSQNNNNEETEVKNTNSCLNTNDEEKNDSLDESEILNITKRKIRKVLGSIDIITLPSIMTETISNYNKQNIHEIQQLLRILLAEANNLRHPTHTALLHEAIRSIQTLDDNACQKLFWSLREDYQRRTVYISYLSRCRQQLLSTLAYFESLIEHIEREKNICSFNLISISVRQFLEKKERSVQLFIKKFQSLIAADEKAQLVDKFLMFLFNTVDNDAQWQTINEEQLEIAKQVIERHVMSQIYIHALYPNGDGDVLRDQILHQHMQNLSKIITPNHKALGISKLYMAECPWPSAQAEILSLGAYKTPRDKVKCVVRCVTNIMNLLSITSDKSIPAADDLMPVLVFVLIKANPTSLLSTVQYVNSFYDKHFDGEDAYWWTQFCSAIEFIKTMD